LNIAPSATYFKLHLQLAVFH